MTVLKYIFIFALLAIVAESAKTSAELKVHFVQLVVDCSKTYPVTMEEMAALRSRKPPNSTNSKCLLACCYRKLEMIDDKGMFNINNSNEFAEKEIEEAKVEKAKKMFELCSNVNDATVSDGSKGCERAALLYNCFIENAEKAGIHFL